jgi:uncharacterized protein YifE (UPF0438 family)
VRAASPVSGGTVGQTGDMVDSNELLLPIFEIKLEPDELMQFQKEAKFWYSLEHGYKEPTTPKQDHFVRACRGEVTPKNRHERLWLKARPLLQQQHALVEHAVKGLAWQSETDNALVTAARSSLERQPWQHLPEPTIRFLGTLVAEAIFLQQPRYVYGGRPSGGKRR